MKFDYSKLRQRIEAFGVAEFAEEMGISEGRLGMLLCGQSEWAKAEIEKAAVLLDIPAEQIDSEFFTLAEDGEAYKELAELVPELDDSSMLCFTAVIAAMSAPEDEVSVKALKLCSGRAPEEYRAAAAKQMKLIEKAEREFPETVKTARKALRILQVLEDDAVKAEG